MNFFNILILLFVLTALTIGSGFQGEDISLVDKSIDNASQVVNNITLTYDGGETDIPNMDGIYLVIEKYIHFIGTFLFEVMRAGITFGHENPNYFEPTFIFSIIKLIVILVIISLLITPLFYLGIIIVMFFIWILERIKKKKLNSKEKKLEEEK